MRQREKPVIEKFMLPNPQWQDCYRIFCKKFCKVRGYLILFQDGEERFVSLDRKGGKRGHQEIFQKHSEFQWMINFFEKFLTQEEQKGISEEDAFFYAPKSFLILPLRHFGRLKGMLFLGSIEAFDATQQHAASLFNAFASSQVELAYKNFELNNFYETVHPRALALSTMHSVHRVISSSLRLKDLLPRIGRLSAQVLKAQGCSIMLVDPNHEYLVPYFSFGKNKRFVHSQRLRIGKGLLGNIAETGEYYLSRKAISVPFIEDDIVGIIVLWDKLDEQIFSKIDLEILKSLSEQAVVAIKNARLFEETEQLTLGSIRTINELLELNFGGSREELPVFGKIVLEIAKELELPARERVHLERAIFLLDTGALALPSQLIQKKGKLTKREYDQFKRIPSRGVDLLKQISSLQPITPIILHHHERYDGKGYPEGLAGEEIPVGARIISVVNSFLAMISKRSYRESKSIAQGIAEIKMNRGTQFDPKIVDCFVKVAVRSEIMKQIQAMKKKERE